MLTTTLCAALSAAGLALALLTAYRRRFLRATRIAALALLPVGLAMAGLVTLGRRVGVAVGDWAAGLVLRPTVWAGFAVLACAALLYGITRLIAGRGEPVGDGVPARPGARPAAGPGGEPSPALPAKPAQAPARGRGRDSGLSGFEDVEEILKRRGL